MVSTSVSFAAAAVIVCGGAAVAAAAAASASSSSSASSVVLDASGGDPLSSSPLPDLALRIASAAVASSSSLAASSYYVQGRDITEVARVVGSVGAGAVLGVSAYVLALASAPLLVSLPREGSGSLRVAAARCASALFESAASSSSSAMVLF